MKHSYFTIWLLFGQLLAQILIYRKSNYLALLPILFRKCQNSIQDFLHQDLNYQILIQIYTSNYLATSVAHTVTQRSPVGGRHRPHEITTKRQLEQQFCQRVTATSFSCRFLGYSSLIALDQLSARSMNGYPASRS